jgi:hypothetical protein
VEGENLQKLVKKQAEIIRRQEAEIADLKVQIVELKTIIARLQKDSRNSSKPPSSDIIKPKAQAQKQGGGANMNEHRELIVRRAPGTAPEHKEARLIAERLREWEEEERFRFIEAALEPTNNPAELTIRQTALDRVVTQGRRGIAGNEWHGRFWTVLTTCTMQNTSVMNYLKKCLAAFFSFDSFPDDINLAESL